MIGFEAVSRWWNDKQRIKALERQREEARRRHSASIREAKTEAEEEGLTYDLRDEDEPLVAELERIKSDGMVRWARRWRVSVPPEWWDTATLNESRRFDLETRIRDARFRWWDSWPKLTLQAIGVCVAITALVFNVELRRWLWPSPVESQPQSVSGPPSGEQKSTPVSTAPSLHPSASPSTTRSAPTSEATATPSRGVTQKQTESAQPASKDSLSPPLPESPAERATKFPLPSCPPEFTDKAPGVTLSTGDVVVAASPNLFRIDSRGKETRILSSVFLADARAIALEPDGNILVATMLCRDGLVVRIDPRTGTQTPIVGGFRAPVGLFVEASGETALVGDEHSDGYGSGSRGALVRVNLRTGERTVEYVFRGAEVATGIAMHPTSRSIYFTATALYRLDRAEGNNVARRIDIEGLGSPRALTITPRGELYVGDSQRLSVMRVDLTTRTTTEIVGNQSGFGGGWIGLASALDGRSLIVGSSHGVVTNVPLQPAAAKETELWKGQRTGGLGVFVAVVGKGR